MLLPWWDATIEPGELHAGDLVLPTGVIVACDPLCSLDRATPFTTTVPPGTYPVVIGMRDGSVAYARLDLAEGELSAWLPAMCPDEATPTNLRDTPGYPVDAGTGCFVDTSCTAAAEAAAPALLDRLNAAGYNRNGHAMVPAGDGNLIAFGTGQGDGFYASYWGVDALGTVLCLLTNFGLLDADEPDGATDDEEPERDVDTPGPDHAPAPATPPMLVLAIELVNRLVRDELIELSDDANREVLADELSELLAGLATTRDPGAELTHWLLERDHVAEVFATDDELLATLRAATRPR